MKWNIAQWCEKQWWKLYLRNKPIEEYIAWKSNYWNQFLQKNTTFNTKKFNSILDAGCGPAGIFIAFSNIKNVVAIDPLINFYEKEISHFLPQMYPNVKFKNTTIENYKNDEKHDAVFCLNAINHVENIKLSLNAINNSMKSNATLYLSVDTHNYNTLKKIFQLLPGDVLHPHQYDLNTYIELLKNAQFEISKTVLIQKEFIFSYYLIEAIKK